MKPQFSRVVPNYPPNEEWGKLTLWCREVNNIAVTFEHVDLLNCLNRLHIELLQRSLELLVIGARALVNLLDLPPRCAFASVIAY
jgi:hypothetical protein